MINEQFLPTRIKRRPDILADQTSGNFPLFFENVDGSLLIDPANEMKAAGRQWQRLR